MARRKNPAAPAAIAREGGRPVFWRALAPDAPIHVQIRNHIRDSIRAGELQPDDQLPPEANLSELYGVARMTIRQALTALVHEGWLYRVHGQGTFVARRKLERDFGGLRSLYEEMENAGRQISTRLLEAREEPADAAVAEKLGLDVGDPVFVLERLRSVDAEPMTIHVNRVPVRLCPELLVETGGELKSLYQYLEDKGFRIVRGLQRLEAQRATRRIARLLDIPAGSPILFQERISIGVNDVPVEMSLAYHRGDRYACTMELPR